MKKPILFIAAILVFGTACAQNKGNTTKYAVQKAQYGFIENKGQVYDQDFKANPQVKYLLNLGNGMNVQLRANSFSYDTYSAEIKGKKGNAFTERMKQNGATEKEVTYYYHRVDGELINANANPQIIAEEPSSDYLNYYNAVTPESGATNVRHYNKITYKDIYPGIDMVFRAQPGNENPVEYTFVVNPGADAKQIMLHYIGAEQTQLVGNKIKVTVAHGQFTESIPASWIEETNNKLDITYRNMGENIYGFNIPPYNNTQTLIIDPSPNLDWGTYYGGNGLEFGEDITCVGSENVFITGETQSTNAMATNGAHQTILAGSYDAYVVKFSSTGVCQWGTYYGGSDGDWGYGITCDKNENVYVVGNTYSTGGIATTGAHQTVYADSIDAYVVKFNANGIRQWGTYYGDVSMDYGSKISYDGNNSIYISGTTKSTTGIATPGAHQTTNSGGFCHGDAFIVRFNTDGVRQWGTYYGGTDNDDGYAITCDGSSHVLLTGYTDSNNGIITPGAYQTVRGGFAYIAKFDSAGVLLWGTYYGPNGTKWGNEIACDSYDNVFIIGSTSSTTGIATNGAHQTSFGGGTDDAFIAKFSSSGALLWGTYYGGDEWDKGQDISCDGNDNVYITGPTASTNSIITPGAHQTAYGGGDWDVFIAKFNSSGTRQWGTYYGNSNGEVGFGITCDNSDNVFVTGYTESTSGMTSSGAHQTIYGGSIDAFVAKFSSTGSGISEGLSIDKDFAIYPNPVSDVLIIESIENKGTTRFEIINAIGQVVYTGQMMQKTVVSTANFAHGVYLIKLEKGNTIAFKKIVKE